MSRRILPDGAVRDGVGSESRTAARPALRLEVWSSPDERCRSVEWEAGPHATLELPSASPILQWEGAGAGHPLGGGPPATLELLVDEALVVPAGAVLRGHVSARALLLAGEIVGSVHCGSGPVVIRERASLKGQLVAGGDVYVGGSVIDYAGGTVITTPARLVLAAGARVTGDVRSGRIELYEGATLQGVARRFEA